MNEVKIVVECASSVLEEGTSKIEPHGNDGDSDGECHSLCHVLGTLLSSYWILGFQELIGFLGQFYVVITITIYISLKRKVRKSSFPKLHNGR